MDLYLGELLAAKGAASIATAENRVEQLSKAVSKLLMAITSSGEQG